MSNLEKRKEDAVERAKKMTVANQSDLDMAAQMLVGIKSLRKEISEVFEPAISAAYSAHKVAIAQMKSIDDPLSEAEEILKGKIGDYAAGCEVKPEAENVSFRETWTFEVENFALVPREFLCLDTKLVGNVVKAMKSLTSIPGIRVKKSITTSVRSN